MMNFEYPITKRRSFALQADSYNKEFPKMKEKMKPCEWFLAEDFFKMNLRYGWQEQGI